MAEEQMVNDSAQKLITNLNKKDLFMCAKEQGLPNKAEIIEIIRDLRKILFPGFFGDEEQLKLGLDQYIQIQTAKLYDRIKKQIEISFCCKSGCEILLDQKNQSAQAKSCEITNDLFEKLPAIQEQLLLDVEAAFEGDPSAKSKEEVIFSFPGLFAIFVYRVAHVLNVHQVPFIPRIMTEYAHSRTGIDIHAGAKIGKYFFIDHGTGVVVGETTVIGDYVKIYQGVTLGALSTRSGQRLAGKVRHPRIEDHVTIYAGATILGGETVIGHDSVIAGNTFIIESVPPFTKVSVKVPELIFKNF